MMACGLVAAFVKHEGSPPHYLATCSWHQRAYLNLIWLLSPARDRALLLSRDVAAVLLLVLLSVPLVYRCNHDTHTHNFSILAPRARP
eukprot:scaffold156745_cov32-Tisochrysis_lutea.AAC.2